ncbi:MAG: DoxX family protein [Patescibacteria group bacterium]|jgi:putative oxidoreductase
MMGKMLTGFQKHKSVGLFVLRIAAGVIFVMHGYGKLFGDAPGMTAFTGMVDKLGFPMPGLFAYIAALTEFLGGIALILGVGVPVAATLIAGVMLVAFFGVKKASFPAGDVDFALLAIAISLVFMGPGRYTVMGMTKKEQE